MSSLLLTLALLSGAETPQRTAPWPEAVVELAGSLPVQEGGRVKPFSTFAGFTMLRINGMRRHELPSGERLEPVSWLLDVLFFPEDSLGYEVFLVQNADVVEAIGVPGKRERDRYSLSELRPGLGRLFDLAHGYADIAPSERTTVQHQLVLLAENVHSYLALQNGTGALALVPPLDSNEPEWATLAELIGAAVNGHAVAPEHAEILRGFENLADARNDGTAFERELAAMRGNLVALAEARGEYGSIELERTYYRYGLIGKGLFLFVLAFLGAACMWMRPKSRLLYRATSGLVALATVALVAAIVMRCVIRGRPPVSTLYETVLFVTAVGALVALGIEWIDRRRVAVSAAALLGSAGLFIANGYETLDKADTMPSLVAVLDTNFWLATHVTTITIGYSAGMLAALLASIYLLAKAVRFKRGDRDFYRGVGRTVYGVLCFGLVFSLVGTILGGIWANESWGRFWGWDPKENGALLICLSQIAILHARKGGHLREHGVCMAAAFGGTVVAFSWWGVNLLGVGLHSYGFTSGVHTALWTYYWIQWGIVGVGVLTWLGERVAAKEARLARSRGNRAGAPPHLPRKEIPARN
jgi:ABC-type transport system involved in cytochrome c biogenesis permease subunit